MNKLVYPYVHCLHPHKIYNKYSGDVLTVPCGCCEACQLSRSKKMSLLCSLEELDNKYCYFVTLTYSNDYIPLMYPIETKAKGFYHYVSTCERLNDKGKVITLGSLNKALLYKTALNGAVGYASVRDAQLFIKRIRKHFSKIDKYEKVRYYIVAEYGPKHYRPHYHCLLFFNSPQFAQNCLKVVRESWKFGRVDCSLSRGKVNSYVASYVNSTGVIPEIFASKSCKPFALHSRFFAVGFYKCAKKQIYENEFNEFMLLRRGINGKYVEFFPWRSLKGLFYPRCKAFARKSKHELYYSYTILRKCEKAFKTKDVSQIVRNITICSQYAVSNLDFDLPYEIFQIVSYFVLGFAGNVVFELDRFINSVRSELYISKIFLYFCCDNTDDTFKLHQMVQKILDFYSYSDYLNLTNMYKLQCDYLANYPDLGIDFIMSFYDNSCSPIDFNSVVYREFYDTIMLNYSRSIKHKEQNDLNKIFFDTYAKCNVSEVVAK